MWKNYIALRGLISSKDNKEMDVEELFELLSNNGYEFEGTYDDLKRREMLKAIDEIMDNVGDKELRSISNIVNEHYNESGVDFVIEFLEGNTGTSIFFNVFTSVLEGKSLSLFLEYSNASWQISDEFEGILGEKIASKFK